MNEKLRNTLRGWTESLESRVTNAVYTRCACCCLALTFVFGSSSVAAEKVRLQLKWQHQFQFAGYYAAQAQGYYRSVGLEVELIPSQPGEDSAQQVLQGKAEFGVGTTELLLLRQQGAPVVALAAIFQHSPLALMTLKRSGLQSIHDLAEARVMIEPGSSELHAYLRKEGITPDKFSLLPHGQVKDLLAGNADAMSVYAIDEPFELSQAGRDYLLYSPRSVGIDFYGEVLFTTEDQLEQNPERVRAFREASLKGWEYALGHKEELVQLIYSRYSQRHSLEHLRFEASQIDPLLQASLVEIGHMNPGRWRRIVEVYAELGMLKADLDLEGFLYDLHGQPGHPTWLYGSLVAALTLMLAGGLISTRFIRLSSELQSIIREQVQTEAALRESEERYRSILNACPDNITITDLEGCIRMVSPVGLKMIDCQKEEEVVGRLLSEFIVAEDRDRANSNIALMFQGIMTGPGEYRGVRTDGSIFAMEANAEFIRDAAGQPSRIVFVVRDISDRKQAGEKLRKLSKAVEQSPASIVITDLSGKIEYVNPKFEQITGYTSQEALGQNPRLLKSGEKSLESYRRMWESITSGQDWHGEFHNRKKNGELYWESASISPLRDPAGNITHFVAVKEDISQRKMAEAELLVLNQSLAEASARAELASAAKSQFLANMSHEIRTPMNGVIGMTDLLLDTELNDEQRSYAEIVRSSGESLLAVLNDILDFSKIEAGQLDIERLDFNLRDLLEDFASTVALRAHQKGLEFVCTVAPDVPCWLLGDPGRLRQVLTNLAGNAVKFTQRGQVVVRSTLVLESDNEAVIRFSVQDTGMGISADKQDLLFHKFSQVDASTTRHYGGTGLGLAISKQLAERMGGEIGVISEAGQGSEFWFTVRLGKQPEADRDQPPVLGGASVLVVDDSSIQREVLISQLAAWGAQAEGSADGPAALQALTRASQAGNPFRVVFIDMQMPGMDGETLGRTIRADGRFRDTSMVMVTSLGTRAGPRQFHQVGFLASVMKPIRYQELKAVLTLALSHSAGMELLSQPASGQRGWGAESFVGRKVRILVAEDNLTNQQVALGILSKLGLSADAVASGSEALKALNAIPYDLVLMDVQMPELDGYATTRQIRAAQPALQHIPIIAMTAHAMQGDRERCLEAGMNDYVTKPVSPQALAEALDKWLPSVAVFDRADLLTRLMQDEDLAQRVIQGFLQDIPRQLVTLKEYLQCGDVQGVERQAHSIKGAAANVGGQALYAAAHQLEQAAQTNHPELLETHLGQLEQEFKRLQQAMS